MIYSKQMMFHFSMKKDNKNSKLISKIRAATYSHISHASLMIDLIAI